MKLLNIGYGNLIAADRLLAVVSPESAPIKRIVQDSREIGMLIDATYGRKTKSVLIMDTGHTILSALTPDALGLRAETDTETGGTQPQYITWPRANQSSNRGQDLVQDHLGFSSLLPGDLQPTRLLR